MRLVVSKPRIFAVAADPCDGETDFALSPANLADAFDIAS